jgi:hypothetical protein
MRPSMKLLNEYLHELQPEYDFVKGEGYFYFGFSDVAPVDTPEPPESIYVFALNHCTLQRWKDMIRYNVEEWREKQ